MELHPDYYAKKGRKLGRVLYLDFDGVLHPDAVYQVHGHRLELRGEGELFMHAPILQEALGRHPDVRIILSSSWVRVLRYDYTVGRMPEALQSLVVGATWHSRMGRETLEPYRATNDPFNWLDRYQQIRLHARRHGITQWIALDDLHSGEHAWPEQELHRLVLTDGMAGLGDPRAQQDLLDKLEAMHAF